LTWPSKIPTSEHGTFLSKYVRTIDIDIADKVELRILNVETGESLCYTSLVADINNRGISISISPRKADLKTLKPNVECILSIWKDHAFHRFRTRIIEISHTRSTILLIATPSPDAIMRTPRRNDYRVPTNISARVFTPQRVTPFDTHITNLSVSGCGLHFPVELEPNTELRLNFDLPFQGNDDIDTTRPMRQIKGVVASCKPQDKEGCFTLGIEFVELENLATTKLSRYIAMRQRQIIAKERDPLAASPQPNTAPRPLADSTLLEIELFSTENGSEASAPPADANSANFASSTNNSPTQSTAIATNEPDELDHSALEKKRAEDDEKLEKKSGIALATDQPTILVVEDDDDIRDVLVEILQELGYRTLAASDGLEALKTLERFNVDLVISDLMMPNMNGWRLVSALRERSIKVPVIIITGYMAQEGLELLSNHDIAGYIEKPVDLNELAHMVQGALFPPHNNRPKRVLVIDDMPDARLIASHFLKKAGFEVATVGDGQSALPMLADFDPDLVVLDLQMPEMDGFRFCRHLRSQPEWRNLPVLILTSSSSAQDVKRAIELKVKGYMAKPLRADTFINRVLNALQIAEK
jgi:CheY-like chemotaxis protein/c-di-GMP-binding flagellar brake protein YcgR